MYENLLSQGKSLPKVTEDRDRVSVTIEKRIVNKEVIQFLEKVMEFVTLKSKEMISLGLIAQHNALTALDFAKILGLERDDEVRSWLGRLIEFGLVNTKGKTKGKTKGMTYFVEPNVLKKHQFKGITNLRKIEPHRLKQLILEDLERYDKSSMSEVHERIGKEIPLRYLRHKIQLMIENHDITYEGAKKYRRYFIDK